MYNAQILPSLKSWPGIALFDIMTTYIALFDIMTTDIALCDIMAMPTEVNVVDMCTGELDMYLH